MFGVLVIALSILFWPNEAPAPKSESPIIISPIVTTTPQTPTSSKNIEPQKTDKIASSTPVAVIESQIIIQAPIASPTVIYVPIYVPVEPVTTQQPTPEPIITNPIPQPMPDPTYTIEVISPYYQRGLGVTHTTSGVINAETGEYPNVIDIGAVIKDNGGSSIKDAEMVITATDASQNKTLNGTGTYDSRRNVYYYPYHYEFHSTGDHTITFTANGVSESVTINIAS